MAEPTGLGELATERPRPDLADLDLRSTRELVALMNAEDATVPEAVGRVGATLTRAIDAMVDRMRDGGRLVYVGAGTSGRLAQLDAAEVPPTFGVAADRVPVLLAGDETAAAQAQEGAEDDEEAARRDVAHAGVVERDAVVGVSASGRTPYVLAAVTAARERGALTVGVSCNRDAELSGHVDHAVEVAVGPEVIAGSTRLKAGTAQKLVLNTISTVAMVRLGHTFGNLMVDVVATNDKLRDRARRVVEAATGADPELATSTLDDCAGEVKTAIVVLLSGADAAEARDLLAAAGGVVRDALEERP